MVITEASREQGRGAHAFIDFVLAPGDRQLGGRATSCTRCRTRRPWTGSTRRCLSSIPNIAMPPADLLTVRAAARPRRGAEGLYPGGVRDHGVAVISASPMPRMPGRPGAWRSDRCAAGMPRRPDSGAWPSLTPRALWLLMLPGWLADGLHDRPLPDRFLLRFFERGVYGGDRLHLRRSENFEPRRRSALSGRSSCISARIAADGDRDRRAARLSGRLCDCRWRPRRGRPCSWSW